ncbi:MADS-box transcription factor 47-like [Lotus japonicus]|uniref:MADS-box transcription factor 47-like n=1 Tax=Lotus japonicus TaxID=34305 RepID=UPI0025852506|nr:MADS-box transcription factor 47-like [Lotus japonicus]
MAPPKKPNEKKSKAVKKVEEEENHRNVTFSKRKAGLFNKLTELSILCQAETALIIASPNDKLYACGYPSADAVIRRFLTRGPPAAAGGNMNDEERLETLRAMYDAVQEQLKEEKKKLHEIMEEQKRNPGVFPSWWETPMDEMDLDGLEIFKKSLENLRLNLVMRYNTATPQPLSVVFTPPPSPQPPVTNFSINWQQVMQDENRNYYNIERGCTSAGASVTLPPFAPPQSVIPPPPLAVVSDNCHGWQEVENGNCIEFESGSTSSGYDNTGVTLAPFPPSFDYCSTNGSVMHAPSGFGQFFY